MSFETQHDEICDYYYVHKTVFISDYKNPKIFEMPFVFHIEKKSNLFAFSLSELGLKKKKKKRPNIWPFIWMIKLIIKINLL